MEKNSDGGTLREGAEKKVKDSEFYAERDEMLQENKKIRKLQN